MASFSIRNAVKLALGAGMAAAMTAPAAVAQDEEGARELDRVQVTGSRISRAQMEGATPVLTIDREDIDATGFQSIADVLRNTSFNVFGSFREDSGTTAQSQATLSLRGIGSNRTLVLLNGRRMPGSPVLDGQAANLNVIPFAAVERIEILSDGASAIYGSDAIGGVVNIILREDYEGVEMTVRAGISDREGGDDRGISIVGGVSGPRGNISYAVEREERDIIFARDRDYMRATFGDGEDFRTTTGLSQAARTIVRGDTYQYQSMVGDDDDCSIYGPGHAPGVWIDSAFPGDTNCLYDYTQQIAETADLDRTSLFMDANYDINDDHSIFTRMMHSRVESFGRYAPAAGAFGWTSETLPETTLDDGTVLRELRGPDANLVDPISGAPTVDSVLFRFDNTGPARDSWQNNYMTDIQVGFTGFFGNTEYETGFQRNLYDMHEWGTGYVNIMGLQRAGDLGWDPRDPDQEQEAYAPLVDAMKENANRRSQMIYDRFDVGAQFDGPMVGAAPMVFFVGGEYRQERYTDFTQAQAEAGMILGTAGGSSAGERDVSAVFAEVALPLTDTFEMDFALRYDDYSDFGDNVSGKLSARWQPNNSFILRGSYGEGFRAPTLDQMYQAPSQSFAFARDFTACMGGTISEVQDDPTFADDLATCLAQPVQQHETFFGANENLEAETSSQFSVGTVFDFSEMLGQDLTMSLDYYWIEIDNVLTGVSAQDVMWLQFLERIDEAEGVEYNASPTEPHVALPTNFESFETSGIDLNLRYGHDLGNLGRLSFETNLSYVLDYQSRFTLVSETQDYTDLTLNEYRIDGTLGWTIGDHAINWHTYYIPGYCHSTTLDMDTLGDGSLQARCTTDADGDREIGGWSHHTVQYSYNTPLNSTVSLGISNVTDKNPQLDRNNEFDKSLYPFVGRQYLVRYTQRF